MLSQKKRVFLFFVVPVFFAIAWLNTQARAQNPYTLPWIVAQLKQHQPLDPAALRKALHQEMTPTQILDSLQSAEDIRLLRNTYFALAGVRFRSKDLQLLFRHQPWYRGVRAAASGRLHSTALKNVRLLVRMEKARRQAPSAPPPSPSLPSSATGPIWENGKFRLDRIANLQQFGTFTPAQRAALEKHGFFLAPTYASHAFHIYEKNDYLRIPSYVTTDLAIDLTHTFFDNALRNLEESILLPRLTTWCAALLQTAKQQLAQARSPSLRAAAQQHTIYWAVAVRLFGGKAAVPADLEAAVQSTVSKLTLARGGKEAVAGSPHKLDISAFQVRGHYTRSPELGQYFRAMSWLGKVAWPFEPIPQPATTLQAALLLQAIDNTRIANQPALNEFSALERVINTFVGASDAASPARAIAHYRDAYGTLSDPNRLTETSAMSRFHEKMRTLGKTAIQVQAGQGQMPTAPQLRVMGQRAFADSLHIQKVALQPRKRLLFSGLDVAAAMGSLRALQLLKQHDAEAKHWAGFDQAFAKGRALFQSTMQKQQTTDAYHGTLFSLQALFAPPTLSAFPTLKRPAWSLRVLQTALAGWAELRHDTLLYGSPMGAECGLDDQPPPPTSAVEPYPKVYARLDAMIDRLSKQLQSSGIDLQRNPTPQNYAMSAVGHKIKVIRGFLQTLKQLAEKQQKGQPFTRQEDEELAVIGGTIESALLTFSDKQVLEPRDKEMAVVADIAVIHNRAFHVAVGKPDAIYMIAQVKGKWILLRGATMSYYEFLRPASQRLTDEAWRKELHEGKAPTRPAWLDEILAGPKTDLPKPTKTRDSCQYNGARIRL